MTETIQFKWETVESSNIGRVAHDATAKALYIEFKSGGTYIYKDVPREVYDELLAVESHGSYVNKHIKGEYEYGKLL